MNSITEQFRAVNAANLWVDVGGRRIAYRSIGSGQPIMLCTRFRGNLDAWDPAFLDALAANCLRVIVFDYSGWGLSSGEPTMNPLALARDARDLMEALDLHDVIIGGWSLGGIAAQVVLALYPDRLSHVVLIATSPPGPLADAGEGPPYGAAAHAGDTLDDDIVLFFEPRCEASRAAGLRSRQRLALRRSGRSPAVPASWVAHGPGQRPNNPEFPAGEILEALRLTSLPILHVGADHDIVFPIENWYALNRELPTLQLLTFPAAGHAPQHQFPEAVASHVATFARTAC